MIPKIVELANQAVEQVVQDIESKGDPIMAAIARLTAITAIGNMAATLVELGRIMGFPVTRATEEFTKLGVKPETAEAFAKELATQFAAAS